MSLNKFTNSEIGREVGLRIGCSEMDCGTMICDSMLIPSGGDLTAHDIKATNKLETETLSKDGVINYATPNLGQPNFSLHTDGIGGTFWSPDDTGAGDIVYDGALPLTVGTHTLYSSTDGIRVGKSKLLETTTDLFLNNLNLNNAGTINNISIGVLETDINNNKDDILDLQNDKLSRDGTRGMLGTLNMNTNDIDNINVETLQKQISTPSNPLINKMKLYFKNDGLLYSLDNAGVETQIGGKNTEGAEWRFLSIITDTITTGKFNFDNITPIFTTTIRISVNDDEGINKIPLLRLVNKGDSIVFKNDTETNIKVYKVINAVNENAERFSIPVMFDSQTTNLSFLNNEKIRILLDQSSNPFNQTLDTTDDVIFNKVNITSTTPLLELKNTTANPSSGTIRLLDQINNPKATLKLKSDGGIEVLNNTDILFRIIPPTLNTNIFTNFSVNNYTQPDTNIYMTADSGALNHYYETATSRYVHQVVDTTKSFGLGNDVKGTIYQYDYNNDTFNFEKKVLTNQTLPADFTNPNEFISKTYADTKLSKTEPNIQVLTGDIQIPMGETSALVGQNLYDLNSTSNELLGKTINIDNSTFENYTKINGNTQTGLLTVKRDDGAVPTANSFEIKNAFTDALVYAIDGNGHNVGADLVLKHQVDGSYIRIRSQTLSSVRGIYNNYGGVERPIITWTNTSTSNTGAVLIHSNNAEIIRINTNADASTRTIVIKGTTTTLEGDVLIPGKINTLTPTGGKFSLIASETIANRIDERSLMNFGDYVGAAQYGLNTFAVGDAHNIRMSGVIKTHGSQNLILRIKLGSLVIPLALDGINVAADTPVDLDFRFTIRTIGSAVVGSLKYRGIMYIGDTRFTIKHLATVPFNTTVNQLLNITIQWEVAHPDNIFTAELINTYKIY